MSELLLTYWYDHLTVIGFKDNKPQLLRICDEIDRCGNIYVGRVEHKVDNLGAVFVRFENKDKGKKTLKDGIGFLPLKSFPTEFVLNRSVENSNEIKAGDVLIVQIRTEQQKTKQARLTGRLSLQDTEYEDNVPKLLKVAKTRSEYQVLVNRNEGYTDILKKCIAEFALICETEPAEVKIITDLHDKYNELLQLGFLCSFYDETEKSISLSVLYSLKSKTEDIAKRKVWLNSGGYLYVEQTETLNLIDINSGKNQKNSDLFNLELNKEAAIEAYRQIRLRNLSGMILIDFISMNDNSQNDEFIEFVKKLIKNDTQNMRFIDLTGLGIMEFTRDKNNKSIREMLDFKQ